MNKEDLLSFLAEHQIPVETWGIDQAKTIDHLLKELSEGECQLSVEGGALVRLARGAMIDVYHKTTDDQILYLKEDRQVFIDGRVRKRDIETSLGEKLKPEEDPLDGAMRALKEELDINSAIALKPNGEHTKGPVASQSYPGLMSLYHFSKYIVYLNEDDFNPDGYQEVQDDKTTYWVWEKVDS